MKNLISNRSYSKFRWIVLALLVVGLAGMVGCDPDNAQVVFTGPTTAPTTAPTPTPGVPTATPTLAPEACVPSSSIGILVQGTNATAYAPKGNWGGGPVGVEVVPVETSSGVGTGGAPTTVTTANTVNSCSANSATGNTVCVANNSDVYVINGSTLSSTLTSATDATASFSGGSCMNCGVVVDSASNTAVIAMGLSASPSGSAYQTLDLGTNTFASPVNSPTGVSEDIAVDPIRHLILSANEQGNYELVQTSPSPSTVFQNQIVPIPTPTPAGAPTPGVDLDSAGEDCTTGIAVATDEFTGLLFVADLTQATFTTGSPNTWTAPSQFQEFPEFDVLDAGTSGIAIAPGTHLGIVTGEFGGDVEGVIQLPSTSGSGTPAVTDWVSFTVPPDPSAAPWSQGFDPHPTTAYVSPNSGKAFGILGNGSFTFLAIVDLQGLLSAPRTGHVVNNPLPAGLVTFVAE
jgi:hypothetical protein